MLSSDDDILKATCLTLQILEGSTSRDSQFATASSQFISIDSKTDKSSSSEFISIDSKTDVYYTASGDSVFKSIACNKYPGSDELNVYISSPSNLSEKLAPEKSISDILTEKPVEFQDTLETLEAINLMYNEFHQKRDLIEKQCADYILMMTKKSEMIMSPSKNSEILAELNTVLDHILSISNSKDKLRQVLQSNVLSEVWKTNIKYHRSIVNVFQLVKDIIDSVESFCSAIEKCRVFDPEKAEQVHVFQTKLLEQLRNNLKVMLEFQDFVKGLVSIPSEDKI